MSSRSLGCSQVDEDRAFLPRAAGWQCMRRGPKGYTWGRCANIVGSLSVLILLPPHRTKKNLGAVRFYQETFFLSDIRLFSVQVEVGVIMRSRGFGAE